MQRIGQEIYSQAGATATPGAGSGPANTQPDNGSDTIEGEYREV